MAITNEDTTVGQLAHADTTYLTGASGTAVGDDQDARYNSFYAAVSGVATEDYPANLPYDTIATNVVNAKVYDEGNFIQVESDEPTWFENQVSSALTSGVYAVFDTGTAYLTTDYSVLSPYVDSMTLIQASILTGVKAF